MVRNYRFKYGDIILYEDKYLKQFMKCSLVSRDYVTLRSFDGKTYIRYINSFDTKLSKCITDKLYMEKKVTFKNGKKGEVINKTIRVAKETEEDKEKNIKLSNYDRRLINLKSDDYSIDYIYYEAYNRSKQAFEEVVVWSRSESISTACEKIKNLTDKINSYSQKAVTV